MYKHGSNINTNVSIFVCLKIVKQIVYCLWCCKLAWLKFEIEPLVLIFCIYMYIHMYIYPSQCIVYNN